MWKRDDTPMSIKLGKLPFNVFLSVKRAVTDAPEIVFDILCNVRFAGRDKRGVGGDSPTISAGHDTVIDKIVLVGDPSGIRRSSLPHLPQRGTASIVPILIVSFIFENSLVSYLSEVFRKHVLYARVVNAMKLCEATNG